MRNRKKVLGMILLCVSVFMLLYAAGSHGNRMSEYHVSADVFEKLMYTRRECAAPLIEELTLGEETLFYDAGTHTFYYSVIEGNADAYDPVLRIKTADSHVKIAIKECEITEELIGQNGTIELIAYTDSEYNVYQLKVTTLPLMNLEVAEEIADTNVSMHMILFDNREGAPQRLIESDGMVHNRGGTTKSYPKKGMKLSLTQDSTGGNIRKNMISLLGMRQDDDWILYAAYNDQEKVRNVFSCNLWKQSCAGHNSYGIDNGVCYEYVELFVDGQYYGLYALGHLIDDQQMQVAEQSGECVYKNKGWTNEEMVLQSEEPVVPGFVVVSTGETKNTELLYDFYRKMSDPDTDAVWYYQSMDLDNAIDFMLFMVLIQGSDNINGASTKNMYLTAKKNENGGYCFLYTPWDLDATWGNSFNGAYVMNLWDNFEMRSGPLYHLLERGDAYAWERYLDRYEELRKAAWSEETLILMLTEYERQIFDSGAFLRDMERWPDGVYGEPEQKLSVFIQYVKDRLHAADAYYEFLKEIRQSENH